MSKEQDDLARAQEQIRTQAHVIEAYRANLEYTERERDYALACVGKQYSREELRQHALDAISQDVHTARMRGASEKEIKGAIAPPY
jgi:hypothetical protein